MVKIQSFMFFDIDTFYLIDFRYQIISLYDKGDLYNQCFQFGVIYYISWSVGNNSKNFRVLDYNIPFKLLDFDMDESIKNLYNKIYVSIKDVKETDNLLYINVIDKPYKI